MPWTPDAFPRQIGATTTSGLPIAYVLVDDSDGKCLLQGDSLDVGHSSFPLACVVQAQQAGDADWLPAEPVTRTLIADAGGSRIVLVSGPMKVGPNEWTAVVTDEGRVAVFIFVRDETPEICHARPADGSVGVENITIDITVKGSGTCRFVAGGDGGQVYGGIDATVEFGVTFES